MPKAYKFFSDGSVLSNILYYRETIWPVEGYESSHRKQKEVPLWEKYALSVDESAEYFGIGQNRLRSIIASNPDAEYLVTVGTKTMIKRKLFEKYLDIATAI